MRVDDDVTVGAHCVATASRLHAKSTIGPFSRLRPGADIRSGAHIGNFVEVKKSVVHEGAKAMHLTYLGDASVGRGSNIGAGTITCNYDGVAKYQTSIGERVFIGERYGAGGADPGGEWCVCGSWLDADGKCAR